MLLPCSGGRGKAEQPCRGGSGYAPCSSSMGGLAAD